MARFLSMLMLVPMLVACDTGRDGARLTAATATATAPRTTAETRTTAGTPGASATATLPGSAPPTGCNWAEIADLISGFFAAHSRADAASLRDFFPQQDSPSGRPDSVITHFQWFSVTDWDPQQGRRHFVAYRLEELWSYLAARHARHERLQLTSLTVNNVTWDGVANISYALAREANDLPPHALAGKGAINCRNGTIIVWSMGIAATPPLATPGAATPLAPSRSTATR